jgi:3-hydroxyacyl-[acyl-carrier-protein] dehydratase
MLLEYFQMIDNVEELDPEKGTILARADVPMESPVFEGHFPGSPLVPGVLLIETMAQASGFMLLSRLEFEKMPFLANVTGAKMRTFVEPGAVLMVEAKLEHDGSGFAKTKAKISADGKKICDSEIMFRIMPFPNETLKGNMLDRFSQISRSSAE